jgi:small-conductance mechanosensitive channel
MLVGILVVYGYRDQLFGREYETPVQIATTVVLIVLGWQIARDVGRALGPMLFRRLDPGTAGTVGFLIRLVFVGLAMIVALRIAGLDPRTLAVGGAFTAVIVGLAAQQTLGNLIAGTVLLSARPFRVGERVRLQGGGIAGQIEGIVSSLGLLYTTFAQGDDEVMIPNSVVLNVAIVPLREPEGIDLRARLAIGVTPLEVQQLLDEHIETPIRDRPQIALEEIDGDEVVVRISATPERPSDGPRLASEVLDAVAAQTARVAEPSHA